MHRWTSAFTEQSSDDDEQSSADGNDSTLGCYMPFFIWCRGITTTELDEKPDNNRRLDDAIRKQGTAQRSTPPALACVACATQRAKGYGPHERYWLIVDPTYESRGSQDIAAAPGDVINFQFNTEPNPIEPTWRGVVLNGPAWLEAGRVALKAQRESAAPVDDTWGFAAASAPVNAAVDAVMRLPTPRIALGLLLPFCVGMGLETMLSCGHLHDSLRDNGDGTFLKTIRRWRLGKWNLFGDKRITGADEMA
ncbi:hypothetical protein VE03_09154 [Pseudogymnoascus sp. 23342-1-I1]|nr:hypothetical protein VE03_09154 [Pseudogymnoascus sp. 23342-1-I1]